MTAMTTHKLSDIIHTTRLVELGKIKIGGLGESKTSRNGGSYRMPVKYEYFVITTMNRDDNGGLIVDAAAMKELSPDGSKIKSLPIMLLSNDIEEVMQTGYVWYAGKAIAGRRNGDNVEWFNDWKTGAKLSVMKTEPWKDDFLKLQIGGKDLFKCHSVFNCAIVAGEQSKFGGIHKLRTTSIITRDQLYGSLTEIQRLTNNQLMGIPLHLVIKPVKVRDGSSTVYVVHCELRGADIMAVQRMALDLAREQEENRKLMTTIVTDHRRLLSGPGFNETPDESAAINAEFHPESIHGIRPEGGYDPLLDEAPPATTPTQEVIPDAHVEPPTPAPAASADQSVKVATFKRWQAMKQKANPGSITTTAEYGKWVITTLKLSESSTSLTTAQYDLLNQVLADIETAN